MKIDILNTRVFLSDKFYSSADPTISIENPDQVWNYWNFKAEKSMGVWIRFPKMAERVVIFSAHLDYPSFYYSYCSESDSLKSCSYRTNFTDLCELDKNKKTKYKKLVKTFQKETKIDCSLFFEELEAYENRQH